MTRALPRRPGLRAAACALAVGLALLGWGLSLTRSRPVAAAPTLTTGPVPSGTPSTAGPPDGGALPTADTGSGNAAAPPDPADTDSPGLPEQVTLARQHVTAPVVPVGVTAAEALDLPVDPKVIGWWSGGAVPGSDSGSAVLSGHIDSAAGGMGAFAVLLRVAVGDSVDITDDTGAVRHFRVASRTTYGKAALPPEVFRTDGPPTLTLVTCGGPFDTTTHHYRDNVVVTALPAVA